MNDLRALKEKVQEAEREMEEALKQKFPKGSSVAVMLSSNQQHPTGADVIGHSGQGYVRVKLWHAKENSRRPCRDVYFTNVDISPYSY